MGWKRSGSSQQQKAAVKGIGLGALGSSQQQKAAVKGIGLEALGFFLKRGQFGGEALCSS
jgi:hypothetical protein